MNQGGAKVHAVVWRSAGSNTPADLAGALARQEITWEEALGPFDAFARLLINRDAGHRGLVLLLVEPSQLRAINDVRTAIDRFDPTIVSWIFQARKSPHLAPLSSPPTPEQPEVVVRHATQSAAHSKPKLKLAGNGNLAEQDPQKHQPPGPPISKAEGPKEPGSTVDPQSARSVLTPEELEMLLADEQE